MALFLVFFFPGFFFLFRSGFLLGKVYDQQDGIKSGRFNNLICWFLVLFIFLEVFLLFSGVL